VLPLRPKHSERWHFQQILSAGNTRSRSRSYRFIPAYLDENKILSEILSQFDAEVYKAAWPSFMKRINIKPDT